MFIYHPHVPESLLLSKRQVVISRDCPLTVIVNGQLTFLNKIIRSVFTEIGFAFEEKQADQYYLMGYTLPVICFEDIILQKQAIVQFLAEICLSHLPIKEFVERKENLLKMYRAWHSILEDEALDRVVLKTDNLLTKNDHTNKIFEELINISTNIVNKGYQRIFRNYEPDAFNLESVFVTHLTHSILGELPSKHTDYIMRSYFNKQIDFAEEYGKLLERSLDNNERVMRQAILVDKKEQAEPNRPRVHLNVKWFAGVLTLVTAIFLKWSK